MANQFEIAGILSLETDPTSIGSEAISDDITKRLGELEISNIRLEKGDKVLNKLREEIQASISGPKEGIKLKGDSFGISGGLKHIRDQMIRAINAAGKIPVQISIQGISKEINEEATKQLDKNTLAVKDVSISNKKELAQKLSTELEEFTKGDNGIMLKHWRVGGIGSVVKQIQDKISTESIDLGGGKTSNIFAEMQAATSTAFSEKSIDAGTMAGHLAKLQRYTAQAGRIATTKDTKESAIDPLRKVQSILKEINSLAGRDLFNYKTIEASLKDAGKMGEIVTQIRIEKERHKNISDKEKARADAILKVSQDKVAITRIEAEERKENIASLTASNGEEKKATKITGRRTEYLRAINNLVKGEASAREGLVQLESALGLQQDETVEGARKRAELQKLIYEEGRKLYVLQQKSKGRKINPETVTFGQAAGAFGGDLSTSLRQVAEGSENFDVVSDRIRRVAKARDELFSAQAAQNAQNSGLFKLLGIKAVNLAAFALISQATFKIKAAFDDLIRTSIDFERQMVEVTKVMTITQSEMSTMRDTARQFGKEFGFSISETANAMKVYAQQGKTMAEVTSLTRASLLLANVSALDMESSTEALTAVIEQFGVRAENVIDIVDKWNEIANKNAVTEVDLAEAVKRAGAAAAEAGVSFEKFSGLVTAVQARTRRGGKVIGTTLKTVFSRMNSDKAVRAFEDLGIAVFDVNGEFTRAEDRIEILAGKWDELTSIQRNNITTAIAGRRRYAQFLSLIQGYSQAVSATADAQNSANSAAIENAKIMDTLEKRIGALRASWESFMTSLFESGLQDFAKALVGIGNSITGILDAIGGKTLSTMLLTGGVVGLGGLAKGGLNLGLKRAGVPETEIKKGFIKLIPSIKEVTNSFKSLAYETKNVKRASFSGEIQNNQRFVSRGVGGTIRNIRSRIDKSRLASGIGLGSIAMGTGLASQQLGKGMTEDERRASTTISALDSASAGATIGAGAAVMGVTGGTAAIVAAIAAAGLFAKKLADDWLDFGKETRRIQKDVEKLKSTMDSMAKSTDEIRTALAKGFSRESVKRAEEIFAEMIKETPELKKIYREFHEELYSGGDAVELLNRAMEKQNDIIVKRNKLLAETSFSAALEEQSTYGNLSSGAGGVGARVLGVGIASALGGNVLDTELTQGLGGGLIKGAFQSDMGKYIERESMLEGRTSEARFFGLDLFSSDKAFEQGELDFNKMISRYSTSFRNSIEEISEDVKDGSIDIEEANKRISDARRENIKNLIEQKVALQQLDTPEARNSIFVIDKVLAGIKEQARLEKAQAEEAQKLNADLIEFNNNIRQLSIEAAGAASNTERLKSEFSKFDKESSFLTSLTGQNTLADKISLINSQIDEELKNVKFSKLGSIDFLPSLKRLQEELKAAGEGGESEVLLSASGKEFSGVSKTVGREFSSLSTTEQAASPIAPVIGRAISLYGKQTFGDLNFTEMFEEPYDKIKDAQQDRLRELAEELNKSMGFEFDTSTEEGMKEAANKISSYLKSIGGGTDLDKKLSESIKITENLKKSFDNLNEQMNNLATSSKEAFGLFNSELEKTISVQKSLIDSENKIFNSRQKLLTLGKRELNLADQRRINEETQVKVDSNIDTYTKTVVATQERIFDAQLKYAEDQKKLGIDRLNVEKYLNEINKKNANDRISHLENFNSELQRGIGAASDELKVIDSEISRRGSAKQSLLTADPREILKQQLAVSSAFSSVGFTQNKRGETVVEDKDAAKRLIENLSLPDRKQLFGGLEQAVAYGGEDADEAKALLNAIRGDDALEKRREKLVNDQENLIQKQIQNEKDIKKLKERIVEIQEKAALNFLEISKKALQDYMSKKYTKDMAEKHGESATYTERGGVERTRTEYAPLSEEKINKMADILLSKTSDRLDRGLVQDDFRERGGTIIHTKEDQTIDKEALSEVMNNFKEVSKFLKENASKFNELNLTVDANLFNESFIQKLAKFMKDKKLSQEEKEELLDDIAKQSALNSED